MNRILALLLGSGLAVAALIGPSTAAYAEAPSQQGWWTSSNPGSHQGSPTPPAGPFGPDVPANGLLIQGGAGSKSGSGDTGATAYAALLYEIPFGASAGSLTLTVAPHTATTPNAKIELCPLTNTGFAAEQGGPMSDAPAFDCAHNMTAAASSSGGSYTFNASSLVSNGALAVAILPTSPTDRVVLSHPDAQSLPSVAASSPTPGTQTSATPGPSTPAGSDGQQTSSAPSAGAGVQGPSPVQPASLSSGGSTSAATVAPSSGVQPSLAAPPVRPSSSQGQSSQQAIGPSSGSNVAGFASPTSSGGATSPLAVGLLLGAVVIGGALWTGAGRAAVRRDVIHRPETASEHPATS